jgi:hypothetical protein
MKLKTLIASFGGLADTDSEDSKILLRFVFSSLITMLSTFTRALTKSRARLFSSSSTALDRDWSSAPPLVIRNGTVVNHDGMYKADVVTQEGKIIKVGHVTAEDVPEGAREIDATNRYVIPGGIDTHTHLEMPFMGTTTVDDYHYGTTAAVAGGTTCLMDFVIPGKDGGLVNAYKEWEGRATPQINCDIAFHLAVTYYSDEMLEEMETITNDYGVTSCKSGNPKPKPKWIFNEFIRQ